MVLQTPRPLLPLVEFCSSERYGFNEVVEWRASTKAGGFLFHRPRNCDDAEPAPRSPVVGARGWTP